jgi:hypothetical protein
MASGVRRQATGKNNPLLKGFVYTTKIPSLEGFGVGKE